jgi:5'-nucleotidase
MGTSRLVAIFAVAAFGACGSPERAPMVESAAVPAPPAPPPTKKRTISIVGTNDLHGRVLALPLLAGYVENLRAARAADGGGVLLVDAGDMFQGTLESNLGEGKPVVAAYAAMGYHAVAIGNHEFDFGPAGPAATPEGPNDDPRGALKAAAQAAPFPFLAANVRQASGDAVAWPNIVPSTVVTVAGVTVGVVGVTTEDTLTTTISANVKDLAIAPLARTLTAEAKRLREQGAAIVVTLAHAGAKCKAFTGDHGRDCEPRAEIFRVVEALPTGAVDVVVAGHTHAAVAHTIRGVHVIEQYAYGRAFGRVDLTIEGDPPRVTGGRVFEPQDLCPGDKEADFTACAPVAYEGKAVTRSEKIAAAIAPAVDGAKAKRAEIVGTELPEGMPRDYDDESALGNLFADLLRESTPGAVVAFMNGGGLRADLPKGKLTYGALFEAFPFDNRVATAKTTGKGLRQLLEGHLERGGGILSVSGVKLSAACKAGKLRVVVERDRGGVVGDGEEVLLVGSDFLFTGGDDFWGGAPPPPIELSNALVRDVLEKSLTKRPRLVPADAFDPKAPRLRLPSRRPIRCGKESP